MDNPEFDIQTIAQLIKKRFGSKIIIKINKKNLVLNNASSLDNKTLDFIYEHGFFCKKENNDYTNRFSLKELFFEIERWLK